MKLIDWPKYSSVLGKRIDDAKRKQSIYSQISINCYAVGGSKTSFPVYFDKFGRR